VKAAKEKPGEISYGSSGNGGSAHLAGALVEASPERRCCTFPSRATPGAH
jgi:tripartite-type tricarboxylate transporter receptor subunit TctC